MNQPEEQHEKLCAKCGMINPSGAASCLSCQSDSFQPAGVEITLQPVITKSPVGPDVAKPIPDFLKTNADPRITNESDDLEREPVATSPSARNRWGFHSGFFIKVAWILALSLLIYGGLWIYTNDINPISLLLNRAGTVIYLLLITTALGLFLFRDTSNNRKQNWARTNGAKRIPALSSHSVFDSAPVRIPRLENHSDFNENDQKFGHLPKPWNSSLKSTIISVLSVLCVIALFVEELQLLVPILLFLVIIVNLSFQGEKDFTIFRFIFGLIKVLILMWLVSLALLAALVIFCIGSVTL